MNDALHKITYWGLLLISFTPLLAFPGILIPQITPKILIFQVLCESVLLAMLFSMLRDRCLMARFKMLVRSSRILSSIGLFLVYAMAASLAGRDLNQSWWGMVERQDGLFLWIHMFFWLLALDWFRASMQVGSSHSQLKPAPILHSPSRDGIGGYLKLSYCVSLAVALSAILELATYYSWGVAPGILQSLDSTRPSGVMGNPMYLGPYLCWNLFFGFFWTREILHKRLSRLALFGVVGGQILILTALAFGKTRGVFVGLSVAMIVFGILTAGSRTAPRRWRFLSLAGIILLTGLLIGLWIFRNSAFVNSNWVLGRITTGSESLRMRSMMWKSCLRGFVEHPILGWGHGNAYYALNQHFNPEEATFDPDFAAVEATWTDKSHNAYVDLLAEKGVIGLLLFAVIILTIIKTIWMLNDWFVKSCIAASMVAYVIGNLVGFDSFGSLFGLVLTLSFLTGITAPAAGPDSRASQKKKHKSQAMTGLELCLGTAASAAFLVGLYLNLTIGLTLQEYSDARSKITSEDAGNGIAIYRHSFSEHFSPYEAREKLICAYSVVQAVISQRLDPQTVPWALECARDAVAGRPNDAYIYVRLNDMYNGLGIYADRKFLSLAEAAGRKALELSPHRQEALMTLGRTYLLLEQNDRAVEIGKQLAGDFDKLPVAHWFLGLSFLQAGQKEQAKMELVQALRLGYKFQKPEEEEIIRNLLGTKEYEEMRKTF